MAEMYAVEVYKGDTLVFDTPGDRDLWLRSDGHRLDPGEYELWEE